MNDIGLFKSENKDSFLKAYQSGETPEINEWQTKSLFLSKITMRVVNGCYTSLSNAESDCRRSISSTDNISA